MLKSNKASKTCRNQFYIYNKRNGKKFGVFFPRPPQKKVPLAPARKGVSQELSLGDVDAVAERHFFLRFVFMR